MCQCAIEYTSFAIPYLPINSKQKYLTNMYLGSLQYTLRLYQIITSNSVTHYTLIKYKLPLTCNAFLYFTRFMVTFTFNLAFQKPPFFLNLCGQGKNNLKARVIQYQSGHWQQHFTQKTILHNCN